MNDDRPWLGEEPSGRPDDHFSPGATALGVFFAVAAPVVFAGIAIGVRRHGDPLVWLMVVGVVAGVVAGVAAGVALARRDS